jgi:peptidoglycan/LPS O-acetylase OafA/YrhL
MKYRADLDGLRALAILPVLLYHAGVHWLPGGYVGVDVFFVISGFLITSIISSQLYAGTFSIATFYRRRVLRIVPLLVVVLLATLTTGYFVLLPSELQELGPAVASATLFVSNFYFWSTADYFSTPAESLPLLHTWSLSVEEQFYIVYPVLLIAVHKAKPTLLRLTLLLLVGVSFFISALGLRISEAATFYLLPTRAWELGAGAMLAVGLAPTVASWRLREALAITGLILIGATVLLLPSTVPFPGPSALPPILGAVLLIQYAPGTRTADILRLPPVVYIGQISYALYLWHWPIIVFWRLHFGEFGLIDTVSVVAASFILAAVSRRFIEVPFLALRSIRNFGVNVTGIGILALCAVSAVLFTSNGQPQRFSSEIVALASFSDYEETMAYDHQFRSGLCFIESRHDGVSSYDVNTCLRMSSTQKNILLIGDSHAAHLWQSLQGVLPDTNLLQATASGCRPLVEITGHERCTKVMEHVFTKFLPTANVDGVVLAGRWRDDDARKIANTISVLNSYTDRVLVFGPTIEYVQDVPSLLARERIRGEGRDISRYVDQARYATDKILERAVSEAGASYISLIAAECPEKECDAEIENGIPMHFDYGHFTKRGADSVLTSLRDEIVEALF